MADPGYGSYIASAAESERNRRHQSELSARSREIQKYGIDVGAETSRYGVDVGAETSRYGVDVAADTAAKNLEFEYDKWRPDEERKKYEHRQQVESDIAKENLSNLLLEQRNESKSLKKHYDDVAQFRKDEQPSMWDIVSNTWLGKDKGIGTGGVSQYMTGLSDRFWGNIAPISQEDISGVPVQRDWTPDMTQDIDPAMLIQLMQIYGMHSPQAVGGETTGNLLNLAK